MNYKTTYALLALFVAAMLGFHYFYKDGPDARGAFQGPALPGGGPVGTLAPDFKISLLDGTEFDLAMVKGRRVVVINFFATWCGPCQSEIPELNRFYEQFKGRQDLVFLGISDEPENRVSSFQQVRGVKYPLGLDTEEKAGSLYGIRSYPTTVVIGADGKIVFYEVGAIMNADIGLKKAVLAELASLEGRPAPASAGSGEEAVDD